MINHFSRATYPYPPEKGRELYLGDTPILLWKGAKGASPLWTPFFQQRACPPLDLPLAAQGIPSRLTLFRKYK